MASRIEHIKFSFSFWAKAIALPKMREARFEDAMEIALLGLGFDKGNPNDFDADIGLFPSDVVAYVQVSQPKKWQALVELQGDSSTTILLDALSKELAAKGSLHVLRHGFKCFGKTYKMAAFQPASGMNPEAADAYTKNILKIVRQVPFNPANSETIDVVLSLNGIPIVTVELKNPMSGQTVEDAKRQYENDR